MQSVCHTGTFSAPTPITTLGSTAIDWGPNLTADGTTLYFSSFRSGIEELYVSTYTLGAWDPPALINELVTGSGEEGNPAISSDGLELYWGQLHIFRSQRASTAATWPAGQMVVGDTSTYASTEGPAISSDGQTLYFTAIQAGRTDKSIWRASRAGTSFGTATRISELDSAQNDGWPAVTSDELEIFYTSYAAAATSSQLQHAMRASKTDPWTPLGGIAELDAIGSNDDDAALSGDGRTIVFSSSRSGDFDIYIATRSCD